MLNLNIFNIIIIIIINILLLTDGKPINATRASPDFITSNPSPLLLDLPCGSKSSALYLANFAFKIPK